MKSYQIMILIDKTILIFTPVITFGIAPYQSLANILFLDVMLYETNQTINVYLFQSDRVYTSRSKIPNEDWRNQSKWNVDINNKTTYHF